MLAVIAFLTPGAVLAWARASGRRVLPALAMALLTALTFPALPWMLLGGSLALLVLGTRSLWFEPWCRATPWLRSLRVRRWGKHGWASEVAAVGLGSLRAPTSPLRITSVGAAVHAQWTLPLGVTFADVERERAALAAFFDAPRLDIRPIRPSLVAFIWRWDQPLALAREASTPTPGTAAIADGLALGRDESGQQVTWSPLSPASHSLFVGGTRSGKSVSLQVCITQLAAMPDVLVCGIDPTGLLLAPFAEGPDEHLISLGTERESLAHAVDVLAHLVNVTLADRLVHLRSSRLDAIREPTAQMPAVMVVLEEYPAFLAACSADDTSAARKPNERLRTRAELYVQRLLAEGLKAAIVVMLAAQRADADVLGGYRRDQISTRVVFRLESADGWRMVLPSTPEIAASNEDLAPGEGYFQTPGQPLARFRGDHLDYATYRDHVEQAMAWRRDHHSEIPI
ncbi:MAG: FtsK/SpoIIIE domain-containing protein [Nostocoides sp.]